METVLVSTKGWIVIPVEMRRKYGINPGDQVRIVDYGGVLAVVPSSANPIADAAGMLHGGDSLTAALLGEHAREQAHEQQ